MKPSEADNPSQSFAAMPGAWLQLQLLLDSALPIGSFAHSFGLETLVQDGGLKNGAELRKYMEASLRHSWAVSDALIVSAFYRSRDERLESAEAESESSKQNLAYAYGIERRVHLQRLGAETRDGLEKIGRRLLKLAPGLFPNADLSALIEDVRAGRCFGTYPLVYGAICRAIGAGPEQAVEGYLYASVTACVNAALRLLPLGQTEAQGIVAALFPVIAECREKALLMAPEDAYTAMPLAELAAIRHETLYSRLFMS